MHRTRLFGAVAAAVAAATVIITTGTAGAAGAAGTTHAVTGSSKANYSSAVERPTWSFSCDSATGKWSLAIDDVQVIDSAGHTWDGTQGPWSVGAFATTAPGPVPFNASAPLHQNDTNGLFEAGAGGHSANAARWCRTGASVTVYAFSGSTQPLLLDGTLG
jgi:hypothetical protein